MAVEDYVDVKTMGEELEAAVVPEKHNEESSENLEKYFFYVVKIDKEVEASAIPYQQNE